MEKAEATTVEIPESSRESKGKAPLLGAPVAVVPAKAAGYKKGVAIFDLILRLSAFAAALAATVVMGKSEQVLPFFTQFFQFHASYDDLPTFTFFVIAMATVTVYLLLSVPFSIVCIARPVATAPRLLLIIFDTLALTFATSAAGAAAAIVYLAHNGNPSSNWQAICQQFTDFCQTSSGAVVAAFVAVAVMIFMMVLSAVALRKN